MKQKSLMYDSVGKFKQCLLAISASLVFILGSAAAAPAPQNPIDEDQPAPIDPPTEIIPAWQIRSVEQEMPDGRIEMKDVMSVVGAEGVATAPIPEEIRNSLIEDLAALPADETPTYTISMDVIEQVEISFAQGYPTPKLEEYIAMGDAVVDEISDDLPTSTNLSGATAKRWPKCSDKDVLRGQRFQKSTPFSTTRDFGGGFSGTLSITGNANVDAYGEVKLRLKRFWLFGCVPYAVSFDHAKVIGNATIEQGTTLTGTIKYANKEPIDWTIYTIPLYRIPFQIGPVPIHVVFDMPITAGFDIKDINVSVAGSITYSGSRRLTGYLNYTCTSNNRCDGYNTFSNINLSGNQPITAGFSGRFQPSIYAEAAFRGYINHPDIAYAQVGVRSYLHADLWGYYGNNCGDADGDGVFETVDALTLNLDWQLNITAKADTLFTNPWNRILWESDRWFIGFWDLIGSSALTPMLVGPVDAALNQSTLYTAKMRPCWPYNDSINYIVNWGDGTEMALNGAPQANTSASHSWNVEGAKGLTLTAVSDTHGRQLDKVTTRNINVSTSITPINQALQASVTASSTYCRIGDCYSPVRVNDGDRNTALGDQFSWANDYGTEMPQWIEFNWDTPVTLSRLDIYTTEGYPVRNYQVLVPLDLFLYTLWTPVLEVNGNTDLIRSHNFGTHTVTKIRIAGTAGPDNQPGYVRFNEIELY